MSKPMIRIHDLVTNEVIDREMNDIEYAEYQTQQVVEDAVQAEAQAKADARQALLDRLGITAEEAQLLLGGN